MRTYSYYTLIGLIILQTVPTLCKRRCTNKIKCPPLVNYKGTLTTLRNREYPLSNISIAHLQQCIPVFKAPCNTDTIITSLSYNPKQHVHHVNLENVAAIEMPYPYAQWTYNPCGHKCKETYVLIRITWHDEKKASCHFLIQPKRRLTARVHKKIRATDRQLPFRGFKKITIDPPKK